MSDEDEININIDIAQLANQLAKYPAFHRAMRDRQLFHARSKNSVLGRFASVRQPKPSPQRRIS